ncbi:MAG: hypothetical protein NUV94_05510, partial [Candidatus Acetothermia bacterium]|nr:hypothetical protein [Candidatus Acetothermia bacterium]
MGGAGFRDLRRAMFRFYEEGRYRDALEAACQAGVVHQGHPDPVASGLHPEGEVERSFGLAPHRRSIRGLGEVEGEARERAFQNLELCLGDVAV